VERFDYILPPIELSKNMDLRLWVWISKYDFTLEGEGNGSVASLWQSADVNGHFSAQTSQPLYNPALIWEFSYNREFPNGNIFQLDLAGRYEIWNAQAAASISYDTLLARNFFVNFDVWTTYQDYDSRLEFFDDFQDWWNTTGSLGFTWKPWNMVISWKYNLQDKIKVWFNSKF
jgi:hypothetical protein